MRGVWLVSGVSFARRPLVGYVHSAARIFPLELCAKTQKGKHERTQAWFKKKWVGIRDSRWLTLPETTIGAILGLRTYLRKIVSLDSGGTISFVLLAMGISPILLFLVCFLIWGLYGFCGGIIFVLSGFLLGRVTVDESYIPLKFVMMCYITLYSGTTVVLITWQVLNMGIACASVAMVVLAPLYWCYLILPALYLEDVVRDYGAEKLFPFSVAIAVSFGVTFLAMLVGHIADGSAWVPQTLQMLVSNVMFDGVTLVVTLGILSWAVAKRSMLRIPFAIFFDVLIAGVLACCSLYFGLVFTDRALRVGEILNILIGRSAGGEGVYLGPYFWTMHTTFLPTILYLTLILAAWVGKAVLVPVGWFFGLGHEHKSPLKLTASLLVVFSVSFGSMARVAGMLQERCEKAEVGSSQGVAGNEAGSGEAEGAGDE